MTRRGQSTLLATLCSPVLLSDGTFRVMGLRTTVQLWMVCGFCSALLLAAGVLAVLGAGERGTDIALQMTGRLSFLFFLAAYAGGAANTVFGRRFEFLRARAREFGLTFAAAQLVHLSLVAWLCIIGAAPPLSTFLFFGIAVLFTYLLALVSIERLKIALGGKTWLILRFTGINYIMYAFATDFWRWPDAVNFRFIIGYLPFALLAGAGPLLRLWAFALRSKTLGRGLFVPTR